MPSIGWPRATSNEQTPPAELRYEPRPISRWWVPHLIRCRSEPQVIVPKYLVKGLRQLRRGSSDFLQRENRDGVAEGFQSSKLRVVAGQKGRLELLEDVFVAYLMGNQGL